MAKQNFRTNNLNAHTEQTRSAIRENIEAVVKLEKGFQRDRGIVGHITDLIVSFSGSMWFVVLHAALFSFWILINLGDVPGIPIFDPFPFMLLNMWVSLEAIFLATFVLMKQNRMSRREDLRAHLDLQVNLLAEREMTLVLQMLQRISTRLGVRLSGEQIEELSEETSVKDLADQLQQKLPTE